MSFHSATAAKQRTRHRAEALRLLRAGRFDDAERAYVLILQNFPDDFSAIHGLGLVLTALGRAEEALPLLHMALREQPEAAEMHNDLGTALYALGRNDEAYGHFAHAAKLRPDFAVAYNNIGSVLLAQGNTEAAARAFEQALALAPSNADLHYNLGNALGILGDGAAALVRLKRAISLNPNHIGALINLGSVLISLGRPDEALSPLRQALALRPGHITAINNLGTALQASGNSEAARRAFVSVVAAQPNNAAGQANLGNVLLELGEMAGAEKCLAKAVSIQPRQPAYWRALGQIRRVTAAELANLEAMAAAPEGLDEEQRADLHLVLAKGLDEASCPQASFDHLMEGNRLLRRQVAYEEESTLAELAAIGAAPFIPREQGIRGEEAVLVFGMPRSGTTLVEQILASHPAVFGAGELPDLSCAAATAGFPVATDDQQVHLLGVQYLAGLRTLAPNATRIIDKTPGNFRFAGLISESLPGARMVHVRRDPLDTCMSCFATRFASGQNFSYDLAELGRYYRAYAILMEHWRRTLPVGRMLEIDYEVLVVDTEGQTRRILEHCGLDWHPACRDFFRTRRPVRTASVAQVRQPIFHSSVGRAGAYREFLGPLIEALGS